MQQVNAEFPNKLRPIFEAKRYKILRGGRGGGKSWGIARALLLKGVNQPIRVLCARETQKSIAESVHRLLADQIRALGLESFYEVQKASIVGENGTVFTFAGIRQSSVADIKSYEGCDICWVEEAHIVSKHSWDVLIPTIRKEGSEVWISFNPDLESDETYQRFVVNPPHNAIDIEINWDENPWFPGTLKQEMEALRERDPDGCANIYDGKCRQIGQGAYFGNVWERSVDGPCSVVTQQQLQQVVRPWWRRWMSGDWGFGHYGGYYWHQRGAVNVQDLWEVFGIRSQHPISVVATYREWLGTGLSEREVSETLIGLSDDFECGKAKYSHEYGLPEKVSALYFSPDAFEPSIRRSGQNSIADEMGRVLRDGGLPYPTATRLRTKRGSGYDSQVQVQQTGM